MTLNKPVYENELNVELYDSEIKYHCNQVMDVYPDYWECTVCGHKYYH